MKLEFLLAPTSDLAASLALYRDAFGAEEVWREGDTTVSLGMPGTDGYDLIRQVRDLANEKSRKIAAIALTAYTRIEDRLQALRAGYDMHVPKPVELAELVAVAASVVRRSS